MSNEKTATDLFYRFREDPKFHAIVETLTALMLESKIAPDEIRDAAFVASIRYMQIKPVLSMMYVDDWSRPLPQDGMTR